MWNDLWRSIFCFCLTVKQNFTHIKLYPPADLRFWYRAPMSDMWNSFFFPRSGRENTKHAATRKTLFFFWSGELTENEGRLKSTKKSHAQRASIVLTGAIKACCDGVQKGVLWGQEALHHRHLDPGVGWPTAGWRLHHPRGTAGGFQGVSAGAGGDFEGDSPVPVAGTHIYSHPSPSDAACSLGRLK